LRAFAYIYNQREEAKVSLKQLITKVNQAGCAAALRCEDTSANGMIALAGMLEVAQERVAAESKFDGELLYYSQLEVDEILGTFSPRYSMDLNIVDNSAGQYSDGYPHLEKLMILGVNNYNDRLYRGFDIDEYEARQCWIVGAATRSNWKFAYQIARIVTRGYDEVRFDTENNKTLVVPFHATLENRVDRRILYFCKVSGNELINVERFNDYRYCESCASYHHINGNLVKKVRNLKEGK